MHGWPCGFPSWARRFQEHVASAVCPPPAWAFLCVPLDGGTRPGQGSFPAGHTGPASALMVLPGVTRALGPELVRAGRSRAWALLRAGRLPARDSRLVSVRASRRPQGSAGRQVLQGGGFPAHPGRWEGVRGGPALLGLCQAPLLQVLPPARQLPPVGFGGSLPDGPQGSTGPCEEGRSPPTAPPGGPGQRCGLPRQGAGTTFAQQHCCDFSDPWCVGVLGLAGHVTDIQ